MAGNQDTSVGRYFLAHAKKNLSENFLSHIFGLKITYSTAIQKIASIVQFLQNLGIQKGDRIIGYWEDPVAGVMFSLAAAMSGTIFVPLSPIFSVRYLKNLMVQSGARAVFTTMDQMPALREGELESFCCSDFIDAGNTYGSTDPNIPHPSIEESLELLVSLTENIRPEDIFVIQPTSGSTGQPKLVLRPHMSPCRYAIHVGPQLIHENGERPRFLMVAALTHTFGFNMLTTAFSLGAELLIPSRIDTGAPLQEVRELNPTVVPVVPRIVRSFFLQSERLGEKSGETRVFGPGAQYLISAGGSGDPSYFEALRKQGLRIMELYGSTEASMVSMTPRDGWKPGFAGKVLPDVELRVEEDGELLIRSLGLMAGYFSDESSTKEAFSPDGFYCSGDLGRVDSEGYLQILGRKKDIFNTAEGSNIYPERIENLMEALPSVKQAILLGDRQPYISALLVVDTKRLQASSPAMGEGEYGYLPTETSKEFYQKIGRELKLVNSQLERVEQIVRFALFNKSFPTETYATVGPGKARRTRAKIGEIFAPQLQSLYHASDQMDFSFVPGMDRRLRPSSDLRVHLVWLAKDHKALVRQDVAVYLKPILKELCRRMNVQILSGNISPEHVHLFISYPPDLSVSNIVSNLKRSTSSKIFHDLPKVQEEAKGKNLWEQGYLAVTSGTLSDEVLQRYLLSTEGESIPFSPIDPSSIVIPMGNLS